MRCQSFSFDLSHARLGGKTTKARVKSPRIAISACWLVRASAAQAGPPFVTNDPEPPPVGGWEINVPFILERTPGRNGNECAIVRSELRVSLSVELFGNTSKGASLAPVLALVVASSAMADDTFVKFKGGIGVILVSSVGPTGGHRSPTSFGEFRRLDSRG